MEITEISPTKEIIDDGKKIVIGLKPLGRLIHDNLSGILFFELMLFFVLLPGCGILEVFLALIFKIRAVYWDLLPSLFFFINLLKLIPLLFTNNLLINQLTGKFFSKHNFKEKAGKISDFKKILVSRRAKRIYANKYHKEYTVTSWKIYLVLDSGKKIFLHKFSNEDNGEESQRLSASWNTGTGEDGQKVIKAILANEKENVLLNNFWADTGQEARQFVTKLAQRLNLEIEYVNV
jgi:hypothetical protein